MIPEKPVCIYPSWHLDTCVVRETRGTGCRWWVGVRRHSTDTAAALDIYSVLDERLQPTAILYLVGLLGSAQVEYKRVDLQSYEARNGASLAQSFKVKTKGTPLWGAHHLKVLKRYRLQL